MDTKIKLKPGDVTIKLTNTDGVDIGETLVTDGIIGTVYSPYGQYRITMRTALADTLLRDYANMTPADLAYILATPSPDGNWEGQNDQKTNEGG